MISIRRIVEYLNLVSYLLSGYVFIPGRSGSVHSKARVGGHTCIAVRTRIGGGRRDRGRRGHFKKLHFSFVTLSLLAKNHVSIAKTRPLWTLWAHFASFKGYPKLMKNLIFCLTFLCPIEPAYQKIRCALIR